MCPAELAQAGAGAGAVVRRAASTTPRSCSASASATCRCRSTRARCSPGCWTARVRRVQAAVRHRAGDRLGDGARLPGRRAGQRPRRAVLRGVAEGGAVHPARQPADTPLLFLQNTTGYMVGTEYEQGGIIKHGALMINAVSNSTVPHLTINIGASYGAGNYGMCGRAYDPRFLFAWPNAKSAVMGPQQLAGVLSIVARQAARGEGPAVRRGRGRARCGRWSSSRSRRSRLPLFLSGRLYDDGVIDPRDTRTVLGLCLSAIHNAPVEGRRRPSASSGCDARSTDMIRRSLLVANRGEIARRVFATCRGARASRRSPSTPTPTPDAPHVAEADDAVRLPGNAPGRHLPARRPARSRRRCRAGADAVHPGYGFLSENAEFAQAVIDAGPDLGRPAGRRRSRRWGRRSRPSS